MKNTIRLFVVTAVITLILAPLAKGSMSTVKVKLSISDILNGKDDDDCEDFSRDFC